MREAIDRAVAGGEPERMVEALAGATTADVRHAVERIVQQVGDDGTLLDRAAPLAVREEVPARHAACGLAVAGFGGAPGRAIGLLRALADDSDWTVREAAARGLGHLLSQDFSRLIDAVREWGGASSPAVRRAAVVAVAAAAAKARPERAEPLLAAVAPLLADRDEGIRRVLAPIALGSSLLGAYPDLTFERLAQWSTLTDEQVLWSVAMAFSGPAAAPVAKKALIVLRKLSLDERRYVWRAVASALWKLGRKRPEIVRPELAQWLKDERRVEVAREALRHL